MTTLGERIQAGPVVLMDGAMGSERSRTGHDPARIHRAYVSAGAEILLTDTFLAWNEPGGRVERFRQAVRVAREANPQGFVVVDCGPVPGFPGNREECRRWIDALDEADGLILETFSDRVALTVAEQLVDLLGGRPVLLSFAYLHDSNGELASLDGTSPEELGQAANSIGLAGLGVNCGRAISLEDCAQIVGRYRGVTDLPLLVRPNAGTPTPDADRWVYPLSPEEFAGGSRLLREAGADMIGGCCGTTPAHIAALRREMGSGPFL